MDQKTTMIEVFIFTFNRPDFLEIQVDCLKKFMVNEFRLNIIHDTRTFEFSQDFIDVCEKLRNKYKDLEILFQQHYTQEALSSSQYHAKVLQWTTDKLVAFSNEEICLFLDHDIFLVEEFDLIDELDGYDIMGLQQSRSDVKYVWPGLVTFKANLATEIDWNCGEYYGQLLDTGGGTSKLLKNPQVCYKSYNVEYPEMYKSWPLKDLNITFGYNFELHNEKFLHYRNACSWDTQYILRDTNKTEILFSILKDVLNG